MAKECKKKFGVIDILINNAGVVQGKSILEADEAAIHRTLVINAECHGWFIREFLPGMMEKNQGHIVSVASILGIAAGPNLTDYCASKFAAVGFMEALRMEVKKSGKNVTCTTIYPITIDTGMFDGVKATWMLPSLTTEEVVNRTMYAIL